MTADVVVIGSGQAGVPLATRLAGAGRRVTLVERGALGGTCVNVGCTPTKTLIASARAAHEARRARELGVEVGEVRADMAAVADRTAAMVRRWRENVSKQLDEAEGVTVVRGHARLVGPDAVEVDGVRHEAPVIVLNVGARPAPAPVPGLEDVPFLDNAALLEVRELPDHLVVLGGGYIGCELGQAFARLGSAVTIVDRNPRLLHSEDPEISDALGDAFAEEGIVLRLGDDVAHAGVTPDGGVRLEITGGEPVRGTHLLVATGRRPNTDDLGCEAAGVALDDDGFVEVDARYRTSASGLYAVGDATRGTPFTHAAWDDHRILFEILEGSPRRTRDDRLTPFCVFTDPQVARVGLTEGAAREAGAAFEVATMPFGHVARAIESGLTAGVMKVLVDPNDERILGAAIVGDQAGELIHIFAVLMEAGASARTLVDVQAAHPTYAEGAQSLLMRLERYALS